MTRRSDDRKLEGGESKRASRLRKNADEAQPEQVNHEQGLRLD